MDHTKYVLWTIFCVIGATVALFVLTDSESYYGRNIELITGSGKYVQIEADTISLDMASSKYFVIRHPDGLSVYGIPEESPLWWQDNEYFQVKNAEVPGGLWFVEKGNNIKMQIHSTEEFSAQEYHSTESYLLYGFFVIFFAFLVFISGLLLLD
jgi:hypothetical protein